MWLWLALTGCWTKTGCWAKSGCQNPKVAGTAGSSGSRFLQAWLPVAPDYPEVQQRLEQVRSELEYAQWYKEAQEHNRTEQWAAACRIWLKIVGTRSEYRDGEAVTCFVVAGEALLRQYEKQEKKLVKVEGECDQANTERKRLEKML